MFIYIYIYIETSVDKSILKCTKIISSEPNQICQFTFMIQFISSFFILLNEIIFNVTKTDFTKRFGY